MNDKIFEVLVGVWREPATAGEIRDRIDSRTGRRPPITSFYRALRVAHERGWLEVVAGGEIPTGGRPAQRYALTGSGRCAVEAEAERRVRVSSALLDMRGTAGS